MQERFHNLQALRGIACVGVVLAHLGGVEPIFGLGWSPLQPIHNYAHGLVDVFFVMSGFIITSAHRADFGQPRRVGNFLFRRAWRLFPLYWLILAIDIGCHLATDTTNLWQSDLVNCCFLLPTPDHCQMMVAPGWTLVFELMFYAMFAAALALPRPVGGLLLVAWGGAVAWAAAVGHHPEHRYAATILSPFQLEILAGMGLAFFPLRLNRWQAAVLLLIAACWCGYASSIYPRSGDIHSYHGPRTGVFGVPAFLLVCVAVGRERAGAAISSRWLLALGNASYPIYLCHALGFAVMMHISLRVGWGHTRVPHLAWLGCMFAAGLVPGLLLHRLVERPLLNWSKRPRQEEQEPVILPFPTRRPMPRRRQAA